MIKKFIIIIILFVCLIIGNVSATEYEISDYCSDDCLDELITIELEDEIVVSDSYEPDGYNPSGDIKYLSFSNIENFEGLKYFNIYLARTGAGLTLSYPTIGMSLQDEVPLTFRYHDAAGAILGTGYIGYIGSKDATLSYWENFIIYILVDELDLTGYSGFDYIYLDYDLSGSGTIFDIGAHSALDIDPISENYIGLAYTNYHIYADYDGSTRPYAAETHYILDKSFYNTLYIEDDNPTSITIDKTIGETYQSRVTITQNDLYIYDDGVVCDDDVYLSNIYETPLVINITEAFGNVFTGTFFDGSSSSCDEYTDGIIFNLLNDDIELGDSLYSHLQIDDDIYTANFTVQYQYQLDDDTYLDLYKYNYLTDEYSKYNWDTDVYDIGDYEYEITFYQIFPTEESDNNYIKVWVFSDAYEDCLGYYAPAYMSDTYLFTVGGLEQYCWFNAYIYDASTNETLLNDGIIHFYNYNNDDEWYDEFESGLYNAQLIRQNKYQIVINVSGYENYTVTQTIPNVNTFSIKYYLNPTYEELPNITYINVYSIDKQTNNVISGTLVTLNSTSKYTNINGYTVFTVSRNETYSYTATKTGYYNVSGSKLADDLTENIYIYLTREFEITPTPTPTPYEDNETSIFKPDYWRDKLIDMGFDIDIANLFLTVLIVLGAVAIISVISKEPLVLLLGAIIGFVVSIGLGLVSITILAIVIFLGTVLIALVYLKGG